MINDELFQKMAFLKMMMFGFCTQRACSQAYLDGAMTDDDDIGEPALFPNRPPTIKKTATEISLYNDFIIAICIKWNIIII